MSISLSMQSRSGPRRIVPQYARIKLTSANLPELDRVAKEIRKIADKSSATRKSVLVLV